MEALNWTAQFFREKGIATPRLDAEVLLAEVLGMERIALYTHFDQPLSQEERAGYRAMIKRRINGEPVSYIRGKKEFWSRLLYVDRRVLIPRPETETVVEVVQRRYEEKEVPAPRSFADLCCGSGALALALSSFLTSKAFLVDIDPQAMAVAAINCRTYGEQGTFFLLCADLFEAFQRGPHFDLIVANPPYVRRGDLPNLPAGIREYEPLKALDGGEDGLDVLRKLIAEAPVYLQSGGLLAAEIAPDQGEAVMHLMKATSAFHDTRLDRDLSGQPRVVSGWRN